MNRYPYSIYLSSDKKRHFLSDFYPFILRLVFIFISLLSTTLFAGTPGVDDYDSNAFKDFITQEFATEKTSGYMKCTASAHTSYQNFQTLLDALTRCQHLTTEKKKQPDAPILAFSEAETAEAPTLVRLEKLETALRLLMQTGIRHNQLFNIMKIMSRTEATAALANEIQAAYRRWSGEQSAATAIQMPERWEPDEAQQTDLNTLEKRIRPRADHFFTHLLDNSNITTDWRTIVLAWYSIEPAGYAPMSSIAGLLRHHSHEERLHYLQTSMAGRNMAGRMFMKLVAIYHGAGGRAKAQAEHMMEPLWQYCPGWTMENLVEHINNRYPSTNFFDCFLRMTLVDFFEQNKTRFQQTILFDIETLKRTLGITDLYVESTLADLIEAIEKSRLNGDKVKLYSSLLILISGVQEITDEYGYSCDSPLLATLLKDFASSAYPDTRAGTWPLTHNESSLKASITDTLLKHGTWQQKFGIFLITNGQINPYPPFLPLSEKDETHASPAAQEDEISNPQQQTAEIRRRGDYVQIPHHYGMEAIIQPRQMGVCLPDTSLCCCLMESELYKKYS